MKYLLLVYGDPTSYLRHLGEMSAKIAESGELIAGEVLADPVHVRTVGGPFQQAEERPTGFFVVDCDGRERALEIARTFPDTGFAGVEVHPIMNAGSGDL